MKISIVIPSYNYAQYLPRALDSILVQKKNNVEIIIVDDGSTDDTANIAKTYAAKHPNIFYYHQENQGPAKARNLGLEQARGNYVMTLDADDEMTPDSLQQFFDAIQQTPDCPGFICPYYSFQPNGKKKLSKKLWLASKEKNFARYLKGEVPTCSGGFLLSKEAWRNLRYPENVRGREDQPVFSLMFALYDLRILPNASCITYRHDDSLRGQTKQHIGQEKLVDAIFNHPLLPVSFKKYRGLFESLLYLSLFRGSLSDSDKKAARRYYLQALKKDWRQALQLNHLRKFLRAL
ncbi:MAG: glycosyl transferase family 2 [Gammaproteobacteria bacterium]|jgi:glycosyltransferase involved in cell wall biosynthesis|nr:glycosyl transferase family 2 [Gammaproteobacteria bacterium]